MEEITGKIQKPLLQIYQSHPLHYFQFFLKNHGIKI